MSLSPICHISLTPLPFLSPLLHLFPPSRILYLISHCSDWLHVCSTRLCSDSLLSMSWNGRHLSFAFLFFFPSYLSIIFGSDISTCLCCPHHMFYSPSISCPDPEMAFLFTHTWSFLLCLLRAVCSPSQKKSVVWCFFSLYFLSLFMRLSNVFFPNVVCQWCDILKTLTLIF